MNSQFQLADQTFDGLWRDDPVHRAWLTQDAQKQLAFFRQSLRPDGGFDTLDWNGTAQPRDAQELHTTTRLIHSFALGQAFGFDDAAPMIDAGMANLWNTHRDVANGGYFWAVQDGKASDGQKLAYGHVFVLLAGASAKQAGHPDADRLIADVLDVLTAHFWDDARGLLREEYASDWSPISDYRGMNANMHGVEAHLAAFEATGDELYLIRAGRILDFFVGRIAPQHGWRIPEHYTKDWTVDPEYAGNPMFRPAGSTPGHSFELGRLLIQHWDLSGRPDTTALDHARYLIQQGLTDAWRDDGGLCYTLHLDGNQDVRDRYWWPVTEAIGALAVLRGVAPSEEDEAWYRKLTQFAHRHFVDHDGGGWYPELDEQGIPVQGQFTGKPDIYHALQADLIALTGTPSKLFSALK